MFAYAVPAAIGDGDESGHATINLTHNILSAMVRTQETETRRC